MNVVKTVEPDVDGPMAIVIEVEGDTAAQVWASADARADNRERMTVAGEGLFHDAMALIRSCATQIASGMDSLADEVRPQDVAVNFGVKIDAALGAIIAHPGTGAQLSVTLRWLSDPPEVRLPGASPHG